MKKIVIAIDGPAGAGKSTVAQVVAQELNYTYIDTGAMYRAVTWAVICNKISITNQQAISDLVRNIDIKLVYAKEKTKVMVNGTDITEEIRMPEVVTLVAHVAQISAVREAMLYLQQNMASMGGVVMDGRDIGTHVLPNAAVKIFLTATIEERAKRRWKELTVKGIAISLVELKTEISNRDKLDSERNIAPLVKAVDAILIDTTDLSIEAAVGKIVNICKEKINLV